MISYNFLKKILFNLDPENAHHLAEFFLKRAHWCPKLSNKFVQENFVEDKLLRQELFGKTFLNPVGLGAGFDKNATMVQAMPALGFGYTEIGTITPKPQAGNPKPRLFRHIQEETLQNAMGFNNDGMHDAHERLKNLYPYTLPIGVNIGKNKLTPENETLADYKLLIKTLHELSDYMVINISSPNTPGLRDFQNEAFIKELFGWIQDYTNVPVLLKLAPDMQAQEAVDLASLAVEAGAKGIIATNTTIDYSLVANPKDIGGLSGSILKEKSFAIFEAIAKELYGKTTLISVGGIDSPLEAYKRIKAGASLIQVYSALVFKGPRLVKHINEGLINYLKNDNFNSITDAIGIDRR